MKLDPLPQSNNERQIIVLPLESRRRTPAVESQDDLEYRTNSLLVDCGQRNKE